MRAGRGTTHRVAVSGAFVLPGRVGGAEFMLYGIVEGLLSSGAQTLLVCRDASVCLDNAFFRRVRSSIDSGQLLLVKAPAFRNRFIAESVVAATLHKRHGAYALISPNYFTPPFADTASTISSILDLQYLHYPEFFSTQKRLWLRYAHEMTLRTADHVTVISEFVRQDVLNRYGSGFARKVSVVPIGISWERFAFPERPPELSSHGAPFILSVASHYEHKNLSTLLRAFSLVAKRIPHNLVLVGQRKAQLIGVRQAGPQSLEELARDLKISERVVFTGHATDETVAWCYSNADLFVFPSLFEGFGMPAVEAIGMGLPVITTRCGSLPEVTRGFATLVSDPRDPEELSTHILRAVESRAPRRELDAAANEIRAFFHPTRIAKQFLTMIQG